MCDYCALPILSSLVNVQFPFQGPQQSVQRAVHLFIGQSAVPRLKVYVKRQGFGALRNILTNIDIEQLSAVHAPVVQNQLGHLSSSHVGGRQQRQVPGGGGIYRQWLELPLGLGQGGQY